MNAKVVRFELKKILKNRNLTYEEFGKLCGGMDKGHISRLTKRNTISLDTIEKIVNALDLEPSEIAELIKVYE
ncbi:helix-turn-helix domain-containing protein [Pseudalkalibacillus sp. A8]|uniref:helix-turn-helix domain-containing protein n=1 Tax=Pseudalkalibacillus sp. A8 TaxID=3382641 RepID=UPI0038B6ABB3